MEDIGLEEIPVDEKDLDKLRSESEGISGSGTIYNSRCQRSISESFLDLN